jgi:hypothetical protein
MREVVIEGGVDHGIAPGCTAAQAVQILNVAAMRRCPGRSQRLFACIRARQPKHLMTRAKKLDEDG